MVIHNEQACSRFVNSSLWSLISSSIRIAPAAYKPSTFVMQLFFSPHFTVRQRGRKRTMVGWTLFVRTNRWMLKQPVQTGSDIQPTFARDGVYMLGLPVFPPVKWAALSVTCYICLESIMQQAFLVIEMNLNYDEIFHKTLVLLLKMHLPFWFPFLCICSDIYTSTGHVIQISLMANQ